MSLAEGVAARVAYKAYASGVITPGTDPDPSTAPGASGGQILRRVSSSLALTKNTFQSAEVRSDRQIADFRHGVRRVSGNLAGELSCGTYFDFFEAVLRGTRAAGVALDESDMTSLAADNATSKFTAASGDPVALGLRIGMVFRLAGMSNAANNGVNFLITGFGGTSNREITVSPAPTTQTADTEFDLTVPGYTVIAPSTGHSSSLFGIEVYNADIDEARLFTECRVGSCRMSFPAEGMNTVEFGMMGRNMHLFSASSAPFFTSPASPTTTRVTSSLEGYQMIGGSARSVVTDMQLNIDLSPSADPVRASELVPEIWLGRLNVTGTMTMLFENTDDIEAFLDEDETSLLMQIAGYGTSDTQAMSLYLPRIKLGQATPNDQGEAGQSLNIGFQALLYQGSTAGVEATTIQIQDGTISS